MNEYRLWPHEAQGPRTMIRCVSMNGHAIATLYRLRPQDPQVVLVATEVAMLSGLCCRSLHYTVHSSAEAALAALTCQEKRP